MLMVYHRAGGVCHCVGIGPLARFRGLIIGTRIETFCDHNPLQYIRESATKSAILLRRSLALMQFDLEIKYTSARNWEMTNENR